MIGNIGSGGTQQSRLRRGRRNDSEHVRPFPAYSAQEGCSPNTRAFTQPSTERELGKIDNRNLVPWQGPLSMTADWVKLGCPFGSVREALRSSRGVVPLSRHLVGGQSRRIHGWRESGLARLPANRGIRLEEADRLRAGSTSRRGGGQERRVEYDRNRVRNAYEFRIRR